MRYDVNSVRQCAGNDGQEHKVVKLDTGTTVAIFRRRDIAEDFAGYLNVAPRTCPVCEQVVGQDHDCLAGAKAEMEHEHELVAA